MHHVKKFSGEFGFVGLEMADEMARELSTKQRKLFPRFLHAILAEMGNAEVECGLDNFRGNSFRDREQSDASRITPDAMRGGGEAGMDELKAGRKIHLTRRRSKF
jgi:hypothetical protein